MVALPEDEGRRFDFGLISLEHPRVDLTLKEVEIDGQTYVAPTWEQMAGFNFELAKQILESGEHLDRIVALARGGLTGTRDLMDLVQIPKVSQIRYERYKGVGKTRGKPKLVQPLRERIVGETVLEYDEVYDEGDTGIEARIYLRRKRARVVRTAGMVSKPWSKLKPDFCPITTSAWVVFPHERREFIEERAEEWKAKGVSATETMERLLVIGVPFKYVNEFFEGAWASVE